MSFPTQNPSPSTKISQTVKKPKQKKKKRYYNLLLFVETPSNILLCTILSKILTSISRRDSRRCENIPSFSKLLKNGKFLMFTSSQTFSSIFLRQEPHFTAAKIFRLYSVDNSSNSTHISNRFDLLETNHSIHIPT